MIITWEMARDLCNAAPHGIHRLDKRGTEIARHRDDNGTRTESYEIRWRWNGPIALIHADGTYTIGGYSRRWGNGYLSPGTMRRLGEYTPAAVRLGSKHNKLLAGRYITGDDADPWVVRYGTTLNSEGTVAAAPWNSVQHRYRPGAGPAAGRRTPAP